MAGTVEALQKLSAKNIETLNTMRGQMLKYRNRADEDREAYGEFYTRARSTINGYTRALEDAGVLTKYERRLVFIFYTL